MCVGGCFCVCTLRNQRKIGHDMKARESKAGYMVGVWRRKWKDGNYVIYNFKE